MRPFRLDKVPVPNLPADVCEQIRAGIPDLEIGAGQGLHAITYARDNPNRRLLAIERTSEKFEKFKGRFQNHSDLQNLIPLHADAVSIVAHFIPEASLEKIFLLYPNPYPKAKQSNQRWYNSPFMSCLKAKMKSGCELYLSTNMDWYAREAQTQLTMLWGLELKSLKKVSDTREAETHFEKKYLARGEVCTRLIFLKA